MGKHGFEFWKKCTAALPTVPPAQLGGTLPFTPTKDTFMLGPEELEHKEKVDKDRDERTAKNRAEKEAKRVAAAAAAAASAAEAEAEEEEEEREGVWGTDGFVGEIPDIDEELEEDEGRGALGYSDDDEEEG